MNRLKVILAIFKREIHSYFTTPTGYVFITLFIVSSGYYNFVDGNAFFRDNIADLSHLNAVIPWILALFIPAVAMNAWSSERATGTDALLLTLPARDDDIVLGKYLAMLGIYVVSLLFSLSHVFVLMSLGSPDRGLLFANYLGYFLMGGAMLAIAMIGSLLTRSATIAFILGTIFCALFVLAAEDTWLGLASISFPKRFEKFASGQVTLADLAYFIAMTCAALYINVVLLGKRHWSGGRDGPQMWVHFLFRSVSVVLAAIALMLVFSNGVRSYADFTAEGLHTLSSVSERTLEKLKEKDDKEILIEAFVSPEVTPDFEGKRRELLQKLRDFEDKSSGHIKVIYNETEPFTDEAQKAEDEYGIRPIPLAFEDSGTSTTKDVFLGFVLRSGGENLVVPFLSLGMSAEYELTRGIKTLLQAEKKKIGLMGGELDLFGGMDYASGQSTPSSWLVKELRTQYEVEEVDPMEDYPEGIKALVVTMPSLLKQEAMDRLVEWIQKGNPTLLLDDPAPTWGGFTHVPHYYGQPQQRNPYGPPPENDKKPGNSTAFYSKVGVNMDLENVIWDSNNPHPSIDWGPRGNFFVFVDEYNGVKKPFDDEDLITKRLQEVIAIFSGQVEADKTQSGLRFTPLIRAGSDGGSYPVSEVLVRNFFGQMQPDVRKRFDVNSAPDDGYVLAARVSGRYSDEGKKANLIVCADVDMAISEELYSLYVQGHDEFRLDNIQFVLNCIDSLMDDQDLVELRTRRPEHRALEVIAELRREFEVSLREVNKEADEREQKQKDKAQDAYNKAIEDFEAGLGANPDENRAARARLETQRKSLQVQMKEDEKEAEEAKKRYIEKRKKELKAMIDGTEFGYKILALCIPPIPALLLGIIFFVLRLSREHSTETERRNL